MVKISGNLLANLPWLLEPIDEICMKVANLVICSFFSLRASSVCTLSNSGDSLCHAALFVVLCHVSIRFP